MCLGLHLTVIVLKTVITSMASAGFVKLIAVFDFLTKRLDLAEIVDPSVHYGSDQVFFGATVEFEDEDGQLTKVRIVGVDEFDPLNGLISWISPVARAVTKARVGDAVTLNTPEGAKELTILDVEYPAPK